MTLQGEAFLGQSLFPLSPGADSVGLVEKAFCLLGRGEPGEFCSQRVLKGQERLLSVKDRRATNLRVVPRSDSKGFESPSTKITT